MNKLYYVTAYHWANNEWWRFAVTAVTENDAVEKFAEGYSDVHFTRINATFVCTTTDEVFKKL